MTDADKLPIIDSLRFGWESIKKNPGFLLSLFGLVLLVWIGAAVFVGIVAYGNEDLAGGLSALLNLVANTIFPTGAMAVALKLYDGQKPEFGNFICDGKTLLFYFLGSLIYGLFVIVGLFLLIVPGIYVAIRLGQFGYFIVDQKDDPIEAIKKSWEATQGMTLNLILYGLALFMLNLAGFLALIIGIFLTILISAMSSAYIYRALNRRRLDRLAGQKDPSTTPPVLVQ